jgi:hypothetical protein
MLLELWLGLNRETKSARIARISSIIPMTELEVSCQEISINYLDD